MESKTYKLRYAKQVATELKAIENYILDLSKSTKIAKNRVENIVKGIEILKLFPEAGFNADERYKKKINPDQITRGLPLKKDYIVLYDINEKEKIVNVRYLFSTKSDYMKLF